MPARQHVFFFLVVCCFLGCTPCLTAHKEARTTQLRVQRNPGVWGQDQAFRLEHGHRAAGQPEVTADHTSDLHRAPLQWLPRRASAKEQERHAASEWLPSFQMNSKEEKMLLKMPLLSIRNIFKDREEGSGHVEALSFQRHTIKDRAAPAAAVESTPQSEDDGRHKGPEMGLQQRAGRIVNERGETSASLQLIPRPTIRIREQEQDAVVRNFHRHFDDDEAEDFSRPGAAAQWVHRVNNEDEEEQEPLRPYDDHERAEAEEWTKRKRTPVMQTHWWGSRGEEGQPGAPLLWMKQKQRHAEEEDSEDSGAPLQLSDRQAGVDGADEEDQRRSATQQLRHRQSDEEEEREEPDASLQWIHRLTKNKWKSVPDATLLWMQKRYLWYNQPEDTPEAPRAARQADPASDHETQQEVPSKPRQWLDRYSKEGDREVHMERQQFMHAAVNDGENRGPSDSPQLLHEHSSQDDEQDIQQDASWQWVQRQARKQKEQAVNAAQATQKFLEGIFKSKPSSDLEY